MNGRKIIRKLHNLIDWLYERLSRYHIVDLRNPLYKGGWCDTDYRMAYACFNLMKDFVEKEYGLEKLSKPYEPFDYGFQIDGEIVDKQNEEWKHFHDELRSLYVWWVLEAQAEEQSSGWIDFGEVLDEKLTRLMKIKGFMWT